MGSGSVRSQLQQRDNTIRQKDQELLELHTTIRNCNQENQELKQQITRKEDAANLKLREFQRKIKKLQEQLQESNMKKDQLIIKMEERMEKIQELYEQRQFLQHRQAQMSLRISQQESEMARKTQEFNQNNQNMAEVKQEYSNFKAHLHTLMGMMGRLEAEKLQIAAERNQLLQLRKRSELRKQEELIRANNPERILDLSQQVTEKQQEVVELEKIVRSMGRSEFNRTKKMDRSSVLVESSRVRQANRID